MRYIMTMTARGPKKQPRHLRHVTEAQEWLYRLPYLSADQLAVLMRPSRKTLPRDGGIVTYDGSSYSAQTARRALQELRRTGSAATVPILPVWRSLPQGRSKNTYYLVGKGIVNGAMTVDENTLPKSAKRKYNRASKLRDHQHCYLRNSCVVELAQEVRCRGLLLGDVWAEHGPRVSVGDYRSTIIEPDAHVVIRSEQHPGWSRQIFVEADMATQGKPVIQNKVKQYCQYLALKVHDAQIRAAHGVPVVLFFAVSGRRAAQLASWIREEVTARHDVWTTLHREKGIALEDRIVVGSIGGPYVAAGSGLRCSPLAIPDLLNIATHKREIAERIKQLRYEHTHLQESYLTAQRRSDIGSELKKLADVLDAISRGAVK